MASAALLCFSASHAANDRSDLNRDGQIDLLDLQIFSAKYLEQNVEEVDWCAFHEAVAVEVRFLNKPTRYFRKHFRLLLGFIFDEFNCDGPPLLLKIENNPGAGVRIAHDAMESGQYFISDSRTGSVFIYDANRVLTGELKDLDHPLGVVVDQGGRLLVGVHGKKLIEVYDPLTGDLLAEFGQGLVDMPSFITVSGDGDIYVVDSGANRIWVFEPSYLHSRTIGSPGPNDGQLKFPTAAALRTVEVEGGVQEEVFVADQFNRRIQVFDAHGNFLRKIDPLMTFPSFCGFFGSTCPEARGTFTRLQSLQFDSEGRLHSLDIYEASVTIIDPETGTELGSYGSWGDGPGMLRTPLDLHITPWGDALVVDSENPEIEVYALP